jgi:hypothetical protein
MEKQFSFYDSEVSEPSKSGKTYWSEKPDLTSKFYVENFCFGKNECLGGRSTKNGTNYQMYYQVLVYKKQNKCQKLVKIGCKLIEKREILQLEKIIALPSNLVIYFSRFVFSV